MNGSNDYLTFSVFYGGSGSNIIQKGSGAGSGTWFSASLITAGGQTGPAGFNSWTAVIPGNVDIYYTTGKVGIATSTPAYTLDVSGTLRATYISQF
jgi:hypothetical protein